MCKPFLELSVNATDVRSALKSIADDKQLAALKKMFGHVAGELIKSSADSAVQRSIRDAAGDERLNAATRDCSSDMLPSWAASPDAPDDPSKLRLTNVESWEQGLFCEAMQEVLGNMSEAASMRPPICLEDRRPVLAAALNVFFTRVCSIDSAFCLRMHELLHSRVEDLESCVPDNESQPASSLVSSEGITTLRGFSCDGRLN